MCRRKHLTTGDRSQLAGAQPITRCDGRHCHWAKLMGFPVTATCDTAWDQTWGCSDASSTAMQGLT
jgi:hypothetical protein